MWFNKKTTLLKSKINFIETTWCIKMNENTKKYFPVFENMENYGNDLAIMKLLTATNLRWRKRKSFVTKSKKSFFFFIYSWRNQSDIKRARLTWKPITFNVFAWNVFEQQNKDVKPSQRATKLNMPSVTNTHNNLNLCRKIWSLRQTYWNHPGSQSIWNGCHLFYSAVTTRALNKKIGRIFLWKFVCWIMSVPNTQF